MSGCPAARNWLRFYLPWKCKSTKQGAGSELSEASTGQKPPLRSAAVACISATSTCEFAELWSARLSLLGRLDANHQPFLHLSVGEVNQRLRFIERQVVESRLNDRRILAADR